MLAGSDLRFSRAALMLMVSAALTAPLVRGGTWVRLAHDAPYPVNLMLLLSDGTVIAAANDGNTIDNRWFRLTPDNHGSYANGTWTSIAPMHDTRLYYSSQVMMDGRVFVAGGEYGSGSSYAEVYDPVANSWTHVYPPVDLWNPSVNQFYDSVSEILPDGSVMIMPVFPHASATPIRYNPATNTWSNAGPLFRGHYQDEASWVKLPDDSILTIDPFGTNSERYIPSTNTWVNDSNVPVQMYDSFGSELGAAFLLPNGKAFYLGATGNTAIYTPTGNTNPGTWVAGPVIPGNHGTPDAAAAMMVTGKILCAVSPVPTSADHFPPPTSFYEYDYSSNSFTSVNGPTGSTENYSSFVTLMLDLPDGSVLYSHFGSDLYVYQPSGAPLAAGKPVIQSVTPNNDGSYHLSGTGLNGISEGAAYGDDQQMNSNYPLVRLTDGSGNVYYARTYNWSSTSVRTGNRVITTEYRLPANLPQANYQVVVVANGIASDSVCTTIANVTAPPSIAFCDGAGVSLSVSAAGTGPFTYQWRLGNVNLSNGPHLSGATGPTLSINPASVADTGNYNCLVTGACGAAISRAVTLTISPNPVFDLQPASQSVHVGDTVALSVDMQDQYFNYTYQWREGGVNLNNGGRISGADSRYLSIDSAQLGDAGSYDCVATGITTGCSTVSNSATLTVLNTSPCPGDLTGDRVVDLSDLSILLSHYGKSPVTPADGDLDGNGEVDLVDVSLMLSVYGTTCP